MTHYQNHHQHQTAQPSPYQAQPVYPTVQMRQNQPPFSSNQGLPIEQSYIENILRLNRGKMATVYMTFENGDGGNKKTFRGRIEAAGRDHIILSDQETEKRYLLLMVYLDYVTFDEAISYNYPFGSSEQLATYKPR